MCSGRLEFSTSKKMARRTGGSGRTGSGLGTRVAKTTSGLVTTMASRGANGAGGGGGAGGTGGGAWGAVVRARAGRAAGRAALLRTGFGGDDLPAALRAVTESPRVVDGITGSGRGGAPLGRERRIGTCSISFLAS